MTLLAKLYTEAKVDGRSPSLNNLLLPRPNALPR